jgi:hypothetical protein
VIVSTLVLINGQVGDAEELLPRSLPTCLLDPNEPRGLLITLIAVEDAAFNLAYAAVVVHGLGLDHAGQPVHVDLLRPLVELTAFEQTALRNALVRQSWSAWARAPHLVRAFLGCAEPPVLLADAARELALPLSTLANVATLNRLPTIRAGDRHMVYLATIVEAQERGLLHVQRGRPRHARS